MSKALTTRQRQVNDMLQSGMDVKSIALELKIQPATVEMHRKAIAARLQIRSLVESKGGETISCANLRTEALARQSCCPFASFADFDGNIQGSANRVALSVSHKSRGWTEAKWVEFTEIMGSIERSLYCKASCCMAWRWVSPAHISDHNQQSALPLGYCGRIGRPVY